MESKTASPLYIDTNKISHGFIILTLNDIALSDTARQAVGATNRACFPKIWSVPFKALFGTFAAKASDDGYPDLSGIRVMIEQLNFDSSSSSVILTSAQVTFQGADRRSWIYVGFIFHDDERPRRIIVPDKDAAHKKVLPVSPKSTFGRLMENIFGRR
jgi:hypothetical protein